MNSYLIYKYYSNRVTTTQAKYYKKGADGWTEEPLIPYDADKKLSLEGKDYDAMGIEAGEPGANDTFVSDEQADACLPIFLLSKYVYVAKEGLTVEVTYKVSGKEKKLFTVTTVPLGRYITRRHPLLFLSPSVSQ